MFLTVSAIFCSPTLLSFYGHSRRENTQGHFFSLPNFFGHARRKYSAKNLRCMSGVKVERGGIYLDMSLLPKVFYGHKEKILQANFFPPQFFSRTCEEKILRPFPFSPSPNQNFILMFVVARSKWI